MSNDTAIFSLQPQHKYPTYLEYVDFQEQTSILTVKTISKFCNPVYVLRITKMGIMWCPVHYITIMNSQANGHHLLDN